MAKHTQLSSHLQFNDVVCLVKEMRRQFFDEVIAEITVDIMRASGEIAKES